MQKNFFKNLHSRKKVPNFAAQKGKRGAIAQLVEQRTENPCVPGSIPGGTTKAKIKSLILKELAIFLLAPTGRSHYNSQGQRIFPVGGKDVKSIVLPV